MVCKSIIPCEVVQTILPKSPYPSLPNPLPPRGEHSKSQGGGQAGQGEYIVSRGRVPCPISPHQQG